MLALQIVAHVAEVDAAGGDELDIPVGAAELLDGFHTAQSLAGEVLEGGQAHLQAGLDLGGGHTARHDGQAQLLSPGHHLFIKAGGHHIIGPGLGGRVQLLHAQHGAGAHRHFRVGLLDAAQAFQRALAAQGDLDQGQPALDESSGQRLGGLRVFQPQHRDDAVIPNDLHNIHSQFLLSAVGQRPAAWTGFRPQKITQSGRRRLGTRRAGYPDAPHRASAVFSLLGLCKTKALHQFCLAAFFLSQMALPMGHRKVSSTATSSTQEMGRVTK